MYVQEYCTSTEHSSLQLYRLLNPNHQFAEYLAHVLCYPSRTLLSRFRCQCHALRVDTGRFEQLAKDQRVYQVCAACVVEDKQRYLFDCPSYSHIRAKHLSLSCDQ